jgi:hypothetical protein
MQHDHEQEDRTSLRWLEFMDKRYVSKSDFDPVKKIAYGTITLMVAVLVSLLVYFVTHSPKGG